MKMDEIIQKLEDVKKWIKDNTILPNFNDSNNNYMEFAVKMGNYLRLLLCVAAGMISEGKTGYEKKDAVIVGLFVRIYKLYDTLCFHVAENHAEIVEIFHRLIFEASINLEYLIKKGNKSIDNFIFVSYKATKETYEDLIEKQKSRKLTEIEERILSKIQGQFAEDKIDIDLIVENKNWKLDGKSFRDILIDLKFEIAYSYIFGYGSSFVHGDWKDLRSNHLKCENNLYTPQLKYNRVDPRYICPISIVCLDALVKFLKWNNSDTDKYIITIAEDMKKLVRNFDSNHEKAIQEAIKNNG